MTAAEAREAAVAAAIRDLRTKRKIEEEEREKMQVLVSNFSEEQLNRYEMFRRAAFPKAAVKRVGCCCSNSEMMANTLIPLS